MRGSEYYTKQEAVKGVTHDLCTMQCASLGSHIKTGIHIVWPMPLYISHYMY